MIEKARIRKYLHDYKTHSVIAQNFFIIMLMIMLPFFLFFCILYQNTQTIIKQEVDAVTKPYLLSITRMLDSIYSEMSSLTYTLANSHEAVSFAGSSPKEIAAQSIDLSNIINTPVLTYQYVDSVYLYSSKSNYVISNRYNDLVEQFDDRSWLSQYSYLSYGDLIVMFRKSNDFYPYYISFMSPIYTDPVNIIGALVINVDIEEISKTLLGDNLKDSEIYVFNAYQDLIFSNCFNLTDEPTDIGKYIQERLKYAEDNQYATYTFHSDTNNLDYISITPHIAGNNYLLYLLLIGLTMTVIALCLSIYLSLHTFRPIESIMRVLDAPLQPKETSNEIQYILNSINATIESKNDIEQQLQKHLELLNQAYSIALQAQINPHFLYNTLDNINFLAYDICQGNNDISRITTNLSQMLRYSLDNDVKIVSLQDELNHLKQYIGILTLRYRDKYQFQFNICDDTLQNPCLKLILQPIVENAFYHGVKVKLDGGKIEISSFLSKSFLIITITDDGVGMSESELQKLNKSLLGDNILSSEHIGLNNVNRRIKMTFGERYGVKISSKSGVGTTVTLYLPLK